MNKSKQMGMVRNLDSLGRIVLPIELRRTLGIKIDEPLEYFVEDSDRRIIIRKYKNMECLFCTSENDLAYYKNYFVCASCLSEASRSDAQEGQDKFHKTLTHTEQDPITDFLAGGVGKNTRSKDMLHRLTNVMEEFPTATQKKWAEELGVTQGRVSQLVSKLKKSVQESQGGSHNPEL